LGYGDEIIKMLKDSRPKILDFSGNKMDHKLLSEIGDIDSLEKLDFSDCGLTDIPESIQNLKNLKYLKLRNTQIQLAPNWLSKLSSLEFLDLSGCNITNRIDLTGLSKVTDVVLDYNAKLRELPIGLETLTSLARLTASNCDIRKIDSNILNCDCLYLVDFHGNKNLSQIPAKISGMENIIAICIDDTDISEASLKDLKGNRRNGDVAIIKYGF
jgi:Leucine-rich repeat (LRR) protein